MRYLSACLAGLLFCVPALAAPKYPALTGRVVDGAQLLSASTEQTLTRELAAYEAQTSDQVVVVTVPSLGGIEIEEYGVELGRTWGIGQKGKNNGVLLIVAPKERQVRIEVGYGLEGKLTDLLSHQIIQGTMLPAFKAGNMESGVVQGTHAILAVLSGNVGALPQAPAAKPSSGSLLFFVLFAFYFFSQILLFLLYCILSIPAYFLSLLGFNALRRMLDRMKQRILPGDRSLLYWMFMPSGRFTGSGGGGFSGGGGSFGGGGSSGRW